MDVNLRHPTLTFIPGPPAWVADANFMTVVSETRVLPELLAETYTRLKHKF